MLVDSLESALVEVLEWEEEAELELVVALALWWEAALELESGEARVLELVAALALWWEAALELELGAALALWWEEALELELEAASALWWEAALELESVGQHCTRMVDWLTTRKFRPQSNRRKRRLLC